MIRGKSEPKVTRYTLTVKISHCDNKGTYQTDTGFPEFNETKEIESPNREYTALAGFMQGLTAICCAHELSQGTKTVPVIYVHCPYQWSTKDIVTLLEGSAETRFMPPNIRLLWSNTTPKQGLSISCLQAISEHIGGIQQAVQRTWSIGK